MNKIREGLDRSNRRLNCSTQPKDERIRYERSLVPSAATLIVVPVNLLEHWYEQITRHLSLRYFSSDDHESNEDKVGRGIVYLDGLGDIVDVESPLNKFRLNSRMESASKNLSGYLIVVTTFERCIIEGKKLLSTDRSFLLGQKVESLLKLRWLRLIVDEGHELGKSPVKENHSTEISRKKSFSIDSNTDYLQKFISEIAAERR
jgi:SNF2 family DNA or RNA helicase